MQNSTRMRIIFKTSEKLLMRKKPTIKCKRTFLSDNYGCKKEWDKRLETPLLKKIKPFDFYLELDNKHSVAGKIAPVDVDIFVNSLKDEGHTEDLLDTIYKLRMSPETSATLPSTHYAVTRYLLEKDTPDQVFQVLNDRLNYGIFPDHHSFNLLMDTYIKMQDFTSAAKIATLLMLQEDFQHPIANALALYSCHKHLENPENWKAPEPEKDEEPIEEVKIRVAYLRNPFFDDHFDLVEPSDLIGKTLAYFGKHRGDTVGRSCQLRGLIMYKKYSAVVQLIQEWRDLKQVVFREVFDLIKKDSPTLFDGEMSEEISNLKVQLDNLEKMDLKSGRIVEELEADVKKAVTEREESDISIQCEAFNKWITMRNDVLQEHLAELDKLARLENIKKIKKELEDEERLLTFFDKEEEIELKIEEIEAKIKSYEIDPKLARKKLQHQENYVPPDVLKRHKN